MSLNDEKSPQDQIAEMKAGRADRLEQVAFRDAILRLVNTPDWRLVIEKVFMTDDAVRAARCIGDPALDAKQQNDMIGIAAAPGHLQRFVSVHVRLGNVAEDEIKQIDENIAELQLEADGEEEPVEGFKPVGEDE